VKEEIFKQNMTSPDCFEMDGIALHVADSYTDIYREKHLLQSLERDLQQTLESG